METNPLAPATLDDIIFEGRNKAYGAYQLRRQYTGRLSKAASISFLGILLLFGLGHAVLQLKPELIEELVPPTRSREVVLEVEPVFEKVKPAQKAVAPASSTPARATKQFIKPRIVAEEVPVTAEIPNQADFKAADPGLVTAAGIPSDGTLGTPVEAGGTGDAVEESVDAPFVAVEQMPVYADGDHAGMMKFISKHLRYPNRAVADGLEGIVFVSFVVSASGEITQVTVLKDLGGGTGEEAVRVVSKMPRWKPGVQQHRAVPVRMTLPIRFKLS
jgi:protein TonB